MPLGVIIEWRIISNDTLCISVVMIITLRTSVAIAILNVCSNRNHGNRLTPITMAIKWSSILGLHNRFCPIIAAASPFTCYFFTHSFFLPIACPSRHPPYVWVCCTHNFPLSCSSLTPLTLLHNCTTRILPDFAHEYLFLILINIRAYFLIKRTLLNRL